MDWFANINALIGSPDLVSGLAGLFLKAALVLCGALMVTALLRRASASTRHQLLVATMMAVLALPALSVALPAWQVPVPAPLAPQAPPPAATPQAPAGATAPQAIAPHAQPTPAASPQASATPAPQAEPVPAATPQASAPPAPQAEAAPAATPAPKAPPVAIGGQVPAADPGGGDERDGGVISTAASNDISPTALLLAAWLLGTTFFLTRLGVSAAAAWWLARRAETVAEPALLREARSVQRDLGIGGDIRLVISERIAMPMAWGIFRPVVLLPAEARTWTAQRIRVVLLHEMAHLKRRDCQTMLLARLVTALHWFNPLAWTTTRRLQAERERACDDLVLQAGTDGADYAEHLLAIARAMTRSHNPTWATVAMARPSELEGRLLAILDPARRRARGGRAATVTALLAVGMLVLPLAALQPRAVAAPQEADGGTDGGQQDVRVRTKIVNEQALRTMVRTQLEHQMRFDFDLQPRLKLDFDTRLPLDFEVNVAEGLAAGLGEALAAGIEVQDQSESGLNPRVLEAFLTALRDEDAEIRAQAAHSLGQIESDEAVDALGEVLRNDADPEVRSEAAWALGMIESDAAVSALTAAIGDADADVRSQAVWALGMIESDQAVQGLAGALSDEDEDVREQAAWALGMIEDASAIDALATALRSDASADVREQAAWALGMIEDEAALETLLDALTDEDLDVRKTVLWAVAQISG